jgi:hypothetical protein
MSCCGRKLLITEDEKKHILSLYGLIKEDPDPVSETSTSAIKIDKTINFAPGYYRHKGPVTTKAGTTYDWDVDKTLKDELQKIREFLKNNPTGYIVEANLYSGESKIPNNDNELGGTQVKENYLNEARLNSLKSYLNPIFELWKTEGITKTDFKINEYKKIGDTKWVDTPFCPANTTDERSCTTTYFTQLKAGTQTAKDYKAKYDAEQYFRVVIEVKKVDNPKSQVLPSESGDTVSEGCATGLEVVIYVKTHQCQNAEYLVYANNTLLTNLAGGFTANLNNAGGKLTAAKFNFPAPGSEGSIYQTTEDGTKIGFMNKADDIPAQALNPSYGYTKNGPYSANEEGDISGQRMDTFNVNATQSKTITEQGNGEINIWLIGTTKAMHLDIPYVLIKKDGKEVYNSQPKIEQGLVMTLSGCGNKVLPLSTKAIKPTGYESILINIYKERFAKIRQGLGANAVENLSKKQLKDSKSEILDRTLALANLINQVALLGHNLSTKAFEKGMTNATYAQFKKQWDSQANKVARMNIYNQIQPILDENPSFRKNPDGTSYVDKNIEKSRKNPEKTLMGDIFLKLENFYKKYNTYYKSPDGEYLPNGVSYDEAELNPGGLGWLMGRAFVSVDYNGDQPVVTYF